MSTALGDHRVNLSERAVRAVCRVRSNPTSSPLRRSGSIRSPGTTPPRPHLLHGLPSPPPYPIPGLRRHRLRAVYSGTTAATGTAAAPAAGAAAATGPASNGQGPISRFLAPASRPCGLGHPDGCGSRPPCMFGAVAAGTGTQTADRPTRGAGVVAGDGGGGGGIGLGPLGWSSLDLQRPDLDMADLAAGLPGVDLSVRGVSHLVGLTRGGWEGGWGGRPGG
jgi:hypothetical protein